MDTVLTGKHRSRTILAELGVTPEQRSAEIVASLRAVTFPSPEADVLSSPTGRALARFLSIISGSEAIKNATGGRHLCINHLAKEILQKKSHPQRIVELGCGYSGRALSLAKAFPNCQVIEIDLPDVVETKQERLQRLPGGAVSNNLSWIGADLSKIALTRLVDAGSVDLLVCEGMLPYFTPREIGAMASSIYASLSRSGVFIGDMVNSLGWQNVENTTRLGTWIFHRQAGKFKGKFENPDEPRKLFEQAGYASVTAHNLQTLARSYLPGTDVADVSYIITAHKSD